MINISNSNSNIIGNCIKLKNMYKQHISVLVFEPGEFSRVESN